MVQKIWLQRGGDNLFSDADNWTPTGVPQKGDVASISMAAVLATGELPSGISINLGTRAGMGRYAHLTLQDAMVPAGTTISELTVFDTYDGSLPSSLQFTGAVTNNGTLVFSGGVQTIALPSGTSLTNNGTIDIDRSAPQISAATPSVSIVNNGRIRIVNETDQRGQVAVLGSPVSGTGTISVSLHGGLEFGGAVNGQQLQFVGGANADATVQIDQPSLFAGTISGFVVGDTITLANTLLGSVSYVPAATGSGTLQIFNGAGLCNASDHVISVGPPGARRTIPWSGFV